MNRKNKSILLLATIFLLATTLTSTGIVSTAIPVQEATDFELVFDWTSGYADELYFRVITGAEQQVLALQSGEIDLIGQFVDPELVPPLLTDPNILINQTNRRGFGHVSFNCDRAPTNWTALRQAYAYALDKDAIQQQALGGFSRPVDSPIPPSMGAWSLDNHPDFVTNYYDPDPATGNAILDAAGFIDIDDDNWREDPNGNPINFPVLGSQAGSIIIETVVALSVDAFESLHIQAYESLIDFNTLLARVDIGDFNAGFWAFNLGGTEPLFLENFQSDDIGNDWNFANSTYDDLVDTMLESNDEDVVYQACWDAQKILWAEQPLCVAYQNLLISAYRKDPWTGFINTEGEGVFDTWSFLKVHLKDEFGSGTAYDNWKQGGRFTVSLPQQMESTNILNSNSAYTFMTLNLVYDGLYGRNPYSLADGASVAYDWTVEEVEQGVTSNAEPGDITKITYHMFDGFEWHDGVPLTAEDVAYSYQLVNESNSPVYLTAVQDVTHVEVVDDTTVEIFCSIGGLFTLHRTSLPIWPKHIWEPVDTPLTWSNPNPVGSGPYKWKSRTAGELVVLERNDDYFYNPRIYEWPGAQVDSSESSSESSGSTAITGETTTETTSPGFEFAALLFSFAAIAIVEKKRRKN